MFLRILFFASLKVSNTFFFLRKRGFTPHTPDSSKVVGDSPKFTAMWIFLFPRDCTVLLRRRKMVHFRVAETQKAASIRCPFRILRNFVPRKRIRSEEDIPEGIGEGNSKRYLTMKNRRFWMFKYLWEGW